MKKQLFRGMAFVLVLLVCLQALGPVALATEQNIFSDKTSISLAETPEADVAGVPDLASNGNDGENLLEAAPFAAPETGYTSVPPGQSTGYLPDSIIPTYVAPGSAKRSILVAALPESVDLSQDKYFPPIDNQGTIGSCTAWATAYYQFTYAAARLNNWDAKNNASYRASPKFTFNLSGSGGHSIGSTFEANAKVLQTFGFVSWADFPYDGSITNPKNYLELCSDPAVLKKALNVRMSSFRGESFALHTVDTPITSNKDIDLDNMKTLLSTGHVLTFNTQIDTWVIRNTDNGHVAIRSSGSIPSAHAMSIVGYDDNFSYDLDGSGSIDQTYEKGAFKIANSGGSSWYNNGFIWVMYDALNKVSNTNKQNQATTGVVRNQILGSYAYYVAEAQNYNPNFVAEITVSGQRRDDLEMAFGKMQADGEAAYLANNIHPFSSAGSRPFNVVTGADYTFYLDLDPYVANSSDWKNEVWALELKDKAANEAPVQVKKVAFTARDNAAQTSTPNVSLDGASELSLYPLKGAATSVRLDTTHSTMGSGYYYPLSSKDTGMVVAQFLPLNALVSNKTMLWSSSNTSIVTVNGQGVLEGKSAGTATITGTSVTNGSLSASIPVTVYADDYSGQKSRAYVWNITSGMNTIQGKCDVISRAGYCDSDTFKFVAPMSGSYTFTFTGLTSNIAGYLYDFDSDELVSKFISNNTCSLIAGKTYYLNVTSYDITDYTIALTVPDSSTFIPITFANVSGFVAPVTGATPQAYTSLNAGSSFYKVTALTWLPAASTFAGSTYYTANVTLTANPGYTFSSSIYPYVNTGTPFYGTVNGSGSGNTLTFNVQFPATKAAVTPIASAGVSGFVAPVTGATPQVYTSLTAGSSAYRVTGLTWSPTASTFAGSTYYTANVTLTANYGYTFSSSIKPTVNTGTSQTGTVSGSGSGNSLTFNVSFPATGAAVTPITSASVSGFVAPVTGATPQAYTSLTAGSSAYRVIGLTWSPVASTFAGSTAYTAYVTLTANPGYTFSSNILPTVNTGTPYYSYVGSSGSGNTLTFIVSFPATGAAVTPITSASVSGFVAPVTGATPQAYTSLTAGSSAYKVTGLTWSPVASTFAGSTYYTANVTLTANYGYTFSSSIKPTVNTGTSQTGTVSGSGSGNSLTFNVTFPATAAAVTPITSASVSGFVAPVTGATPQAYTSLTAGSSAYKVTGLTWSPTASTFAGSTAYTAYVTLTANPGYTFSSNILPTVNTGTPYYSYVGSSGSGNTLTFIVSFPATGAAVTPITSASVSGFVAPVTGATPQAYTSLTAGSSAYRVTGLTWSPTASTFAGSTYYTANVTLTANYGYTFSSSIKPTVNTGTSQTGTVSGSGSGNSLTFNVTFPATAAAVTPITSASVSGFVAPVTGATPQAYTSLTAGSSAYKVTGLTWSPIASTFAGSTYYTANVTLTANYGYTFSSSIKPTVNTGTSQTGTVSGSGSGNSLTFNVTFPATAAAVTPITSASVSGFVAPVTGATPQAYTSLTAGSSAYKVTALTWSPTGSTFAGSTYYTANVTLTANSGYTFSSSILPTVNTGTPYYSYVNGSGSGNTLTFYVSFPATGAAVTPITSASVSGFVAPVTGATPQAYTSLTAGSSAYKVTALTWSPVASTFAGSTYYTANVTLTANYGYTFSSSIKPTVNTGTSQTGTVSGSGSGNSLTFNVTFPATAAAVTPITSASVSGFVAPVTGATPQAYTSLTAGSSAYKVTALTWSPIGPAFAGSTAYIAHVTLTANSGYTFNSSIRPIVNTGTSYAGAVSGSGSGNTLTFPVAFPTTAAIANDDYGNTFAAAYNWALSAGATHIRSGNFETVGDVDMIKFTAPVTGIYQLYTSDNILSAGSGALDTMGVLYDSAQGWMASSDDEVIGNFSLNFKITALLTQGQVYYLRISTYGNSQTGTYKVNIKVP